VKPAQAIWRFSLEPAVQGHGESWVVYSELHRVSGAGRLIQNTSVNYLGRDQVERGLVDGIDGVTYAVGWATIGHLHTLRESWGVWSDLGPGESLMYAKLRAIGFAVVPRTTRSRQALMAQLREGRRAIEDAYNTPIDSFDRLQKTLYGLFPAGNMKVMVDEKLVETFRPERAIISVDMES